MTALVSWGLAMVIGINSLQGSHLEIETRFVSVTPEMANGILRDFDPGWARNRPENQKRGKVVFLNDAQVQQVLKQCAEDRLANTVQLPRMKVFDGASGRFQITDHQVYMTSIKTIWENGKLTTIPKNEAIETGIRYTVKPRISADKRFVQMGIQLAMTSVDENVPLAHVTVPIAEVNEKTSKLETKNFPVALQCPHINTLTLNKQCTIPDGGSALFYGGTMPRENQFQPTLTVLNQIPYLGRLFHNPGNSQNYQTIFILVTAKALEK